MYVGNILTNLILVNKFLETDEYSIYGLGVLRDLLFGRSWMESGNFPRVTLCDFEVRVLGNNQRHSVQCVLVINIFNEKIFILIWLWFSLLFVAATLDAMYWFSISLFHRDRFRFVLRHLELTSDPDRPELFRKEKRKQVEHFLRTYLKCVLVINIFNEKIFILIWLWFSLLFVAATLDAMYWFSISLFHRDRFRFVLRHLELTSDPDRPELFRKEKRKQVEHFLRTYLKVDGVLVLRMIALHAGVMYCTEITDALWKRYLSQHPENLIDEDSSLINFARTQSIRRKRVNADDGSGSAPQNSSQRLTRFLSSRSQSSLRLHRGQSANRSLNTERSQAPQTLAKRTIVTITSPSQDDTSDVEQRNITNTQRGEPGGSPLII
ncbi:Innexin-10 [Toxocara canis]|uniref:Innexin n=1 Tax=Toxocara canis TaxID=6265 RepID=A0A0B2UWW6_TOXCA|nr:Innexin-10 [Toxocara canis]